MLWLVSFRFLFFLFAASIVVGFFVYSTREATEAVSIDSFTKYLPLLSRNELEDEKNISISVEEFMDGPVTISQDNPVLLKKIRKSFLTPPSTQPYNLLTEDPDTSMGQARQIRNILHDQKGGFFVECGALDGETRSNTLLFEKSFGWSGLLIEGDPRNYQLLLQKRRKAWSISACLSALPYPSKVVFRQQFNIGKIVDSQPEEPLGEGQMATNHAVVQCLPLYSILAALNRTTVDYFSLDIEGLELEVLKTIPWDKVNIRTLSVEFIHGKENKEVMRQYMESKGYEVYTEVTHPGYLANDYIFAKKGLLRDAGLSPKPHF